MTYDEWLLDLVVPRVEYGKPATFHDSFVKGTNYLISEAPNWAYRINSRVYSRYFKEDFFKETHTIPKKGTVITKGSFHTLKGQTCTYEVISESQVEVDRPGFTYSKITFPFDAFIEIAETIHGRT